MRSHSHAPNDRVATLSDVMAAADSLWPFHLQQDWDASGLVTGRPQQAVQRIHFAVDPVNTVVREALAASADLLITHHPLLLRGATSVAADTFKGQVVHDLIESRCALLCCHTNADAARRGVSEALISAAGINADDTVPLLPDTGEPSVGLGRVGTLDTAVSLRELAERLARFLPATAQGLRVAGDPDRAVSTVAVCGGSGDSLFETVRAAGADVYITADLRPHPASEARERALGPAGDGTPALIDASHSASEALWLPWAAADLHGTLAARGFRTEVFVSNLRTDPWDFRVAETREEAPVPENP